MNPLYLTYQIQMRKHSQTPIISELHHDQQELAMIRGQQQMVARVEGTLKKKDQEISKLRAVLEKYQHYQQKYTSLKGELEEKNQAIVRKENECRLMRRQAQELARDLEQAQMREREWEQEKASLVRDRHALEVKRGRRSQRISRSRIHTWSTKMSVGRESRVCS